MGKGLRLLLKSCRKKSGWVKSEDFGGHGTSPKREIKPPGKAALIRAAFPGGFAIVLP